jgi:uncharacterized protein
VIDLAHIPIIDHHAHPFLRRAATDEPARFRRWFTESTDATIQRDHVPNGLLYRTAIRWLAEFLGCDSTIEAILAARAHYSEAEFTARLFADVNIGMVLCDYGYGSAEAYDHAGMQALLPCPVHPMLRIERLAEELILTEPDFASMINTFTAQLMDARSKGVVAFKSIIAYRTGLQIGPTDITLAEAAFHRLKAEARTTGRIRLAQKPLCDYLVQLALAEAERQSLPMQFHTGFGDSDADLRLANPLHLRSIIEQYPTVQLVLLHAGWPYFRELAHLAAIYPNVWLDLSLAVPFATVGIPAMIRDILGMTPWSKVLFATDAFTMPEIYWVAARWGRWGLTQVLDELIRQGFLSEGEALAAAQAILSDNARQLYGV